MDPCTHVRLKARDAHRRAFALCRERSARAIIEAALRERDLEVVAFTPGTRFAPGVLGVYERVGRLISVDATLAPGVRERVVAHEIGHHDLHGDPIEEVSTLDLDAGGEAQVAAYSRRERREIEAEVFAGELLCPGDWLREEIVDRGRHPDDIAAAVDLPQSFVAERSVRVLCLPALDDTISQPRPPRVLTAEQMRAATWAEGPLLVNAGPGTGKTATLVGRVEHLLARGVDASRILVLAFSARAAAELRGWIDDLPGSAGGIWTGTIHGFGSEVVHGWHGRLGRGSRVRIVDRLAAVELLEPCLDEFPARYRARSGHPAAALLPLLQAIGRCKAAMVTADAFAAAARSADSDGVAATCSADDFSLAFAAYEAVLRRHGAIDLDDLVHLATLLFENNDDISIHHGKRFAHVLLDEAQDLDPAATRLLQSLCGPATCLWAVGDVNQCIHRFRGATTGGMEDFVGLFGGETMTLTENFRGAPDIVDACSRFAGRSDVQGKRSPIEGGSEAAVRVFSMPTVADEAAAVADEIGRLVGDGTALSEQAVIARSHRALDDMARRLSLHGVPVLHVGDIIARDDIKDALAVLSAARGGEPAGLLRLTAQGPFAVPREDALAVVRMALREGSPVLDVLQRPRMRGIAAASAATLARLGDHLAAIGITPDAGAAAIMARWLFATHRERTDVVVRLALFRLIQFARSGRPDVEGFMRRIRRMVALDAGRDVGAITPEMDCDGLVRMLTIHESKGLEFCAVHLPGLSAAHMPVRRRPDRFHPPPELAFLSMAGSEHDDEERSLCFVAMSRAREALSISYPRRGTAGGHARPSPFLKRIGDPLHRGGTTGRLDGAPPRAVPPVTTPKGASHRLDDLEVYSACPARYRFERIDGLAELARPDAEELSRTAALRALRELDAGRIHGAPTDGEIRAALALAWREVGLIGDRGGPDLWRSARLFVGRMADAYAVMPGSFRSSPTWSIAVGGATVDVAPDRVIEHPWETIVIQTFVAGSDEERCLPWKAALQIAAGQQAFPAMRVIFEPIRSMDGKSIDLVPDDEHVALDRCAGLIADIESGCFSPHPSPQRCSTCPFLVACGA